MDYDTIRSKLIQLQVKLTDRRCRIPGGRDYADAVEACLALAARERRHCEVIAELREQLERSTSARQ